METQTITPETPVFTDNPLINVTEAAAGKIRELLNEEGKTGAACACSCRAAAARASSTA